MRRDAADWMLSEAMRALARVEQMHSRFFGLATGEHGAFWEPPVDVFETDAELLVIVALPGVAAEHTEVLLERGELVIRGLRVLPPELRKATIHRMELPQGRFERRVQIPSGPYSIHRQMANGCVLLRLTKLGPGGAP